MGNITSSNNEIIKVIPVTLRILTSNVFFEFSIFIVVERLGKITTIFFVRIEMFVKKKS